MTNITQHNADGNDINSIDPPLSITYSIQKNNIIVENYGS